MAIQNSFGLEALEPRRMLSTFTVMNLSDAGAGSLRQAIEDANTHVGADVIEFSQAARGTITLGGTELSITDQLTINGPGAHLLAVDANQASRVFSIEVGQVAMLRGMTIHSGSAQLGGGIWNGGMLTLTDARLLLNTASSFGGGIYNNENATLTLVDTNFENNSANSGAGIYNYKAMATLTRSSVSHNHAGSSGGGIYNYDPDALFTLVLNDSDVDDNTAISGAGIYNFTRGRVELTGSGVNGNTATNEAGGIYNSANGVLTLTDSTVSNNRATANAGGGIINDGSTLLTRSTLSGNSAGGNGGAVYNVNSGSILSLVDSSVSMNESYLGAGVYNDGGVVSLVNSTVSMNLAHAYGGGIFNHRGGMVSLTRSTVSTNEAFGQGGGIWNSTPINPDPDVHEPNSVLTLTNSTVSGNTSGTEGGGIYNGFGGDTLIRNSTIASNIAASGGGLHNLGGGTATVNSTIISLNTGGNLSGLLAESTNNMVGGNPQLAALASNGGPTQTHALLVGSPARGTGNNPLALTTDQRGGFFSRPSGGGVDIGAFQFHAPFALVVDTLSDLDDGNYGPGQLSLREAVSVGGNPGIDTITFASTLNFGTITLGGTELLVAGDLQINGPGSNRLTIDGHQTSRVFAFVEQSSVLLHGLTITGGNGLGYVGVNNYDLLGGGILNLGSLTLTNTRVSGNSTGGGEGILSGGGGIFNEIGGNLVLIDSTVVGNTATDSGGGIFNNATLSATNSTISDNSATYGGGIFNSGTATVTNSTISDNTTSGGGAGVINQGTFTLSESLVAGNIAMGGFGGGLSNAGTMSVIRSTIAGNAAMAGYYGGGVFNINQATVTNSTLSGNSAESGGGIYNDSGAITINNSTLALNSAVSGNGHGLFNFSDATATLRSSIVTATTGSGVFGTLAPASSHNFTNGNALLGPLAANGGPTQTHALLAGSPAINAGSNPTNLATDQRGYARLGGGAFDIGAYETRAYPTTSDGLPFGAADNTDAHRVASVNPDGHIIVFLQGWSAVDLQERTGAANATSEAVIWVDPKDNLTYVGAHTFAGFLLFTRSATGVWSVRSLSTETNATENPTHGLTQFTSVGDVVVVAGITDSGAIVAFQQTLGIVPGGAPAFTFVNISGDLTSQGMSTPALTGLISYVPTWDAWHLAGIDASGRIQSVWINLNAPGFTKWRTDDLTAITGAPAIQGQLAVTLTPWGGINLTGLDAGGSLLTTWWVPEFAGNWLVNNLTSEVNGARFVAGKVSGYGTPWGGLNYVGLTTDGTVTAYWWAPGVTSWSVTSLLAQGVPDSHRPTGNLTSYSSNAGTLNVFGTSSTDDVIRMWWNPGGLNMWTAENLTATAALG